LAFNAMLDASAHVAQARKCLEQLKA